MALTIPTDPKVLKAFVERRHPDYAANLGHWTFLEETYQGGRAWFASNIFRYLKEGDEEFKERLVRAYRFNHTREVVDLVNKYIFKSAVLRNDADAAPEIRNFWRRATLGGMSIDQLMRKTGQMSSIFGRVWLIVDSSNRGDVITVADERAAGARVYAYVLRPQDVLDMGYDDLGQLTWILVREYDRDDQNPIEASGKVVERFRLWTTEEWVLFEFRKKKANEKPIVEVVGRGLHPCGVVPAIPVDNRQSENLYSVPALIADIAYLDRAVANYLSNLDAIIQDQTFSQLALPAQSMMPGDDKYDKLIEMGTKRIFTFDGEGGQPMYISPDPKQAAMIVEVINKIISEIYHSLGMAGERTKQDNAVGIDNSSGVAKAYDFERLNSLLVEKAASLDLAENRLIGLVLRWYDKPPADDMKDLVKYPENFDVRSLYDEFDVANRLALLDAPEDVRREQMKTLIDKLFPRIAEALKTKMIQGLTSWPPAIEPETGLPAPTQSRQGQVTADTP